MLYGTGATVFGTNNLTAWDTGGQAQVSVNAIGVEETSVQDLISPPAGAHLISAVADVGGFTHSDLNGPTVMHTNPVFSTATSLDFAESIPGFIVRVGYGGANIAFSTDGGTSWSPASNPPSGASGGSVAAAADGSRVLWSFLFDRPRNYVDRITRHSGGSSGVHRSSQLVQVFWICEGHVLREHRWRRELRCFCSGSTVSRLRLLQSRARARGRKLAGRGQFAPMALDRQWPVFLTRPAGGLG